MKKIYNCLLYAAARKGSLLFQTLCLLAVCLPATAQQPGKVVPVAGKMDSSGYVLFAPQASNNTYLIDKSGNIRMMWKGTNPPGMAVYMDSICNLYRAEDSGTNYCQYPGGLIKMYDSNSVIKWSYFLDRPDMQQTHDIYPMPNGHVLVDVWEKITNKEAKRKGQDTLLNTLGYFWSGMVVELKPDLKTKSAKVHWSWRFWDHVDSTGTHAELLNVNFRGTPIKPNNSDWTHMNAVVYNQDLEQIMISSRNLNEIYIIEHHDSTSVSAGHNGGRYGRGGDFLYRWGNPQAYGKGEPADQQLFGQHSPYWIPAGYPDAGRIMINNDGFERPGGDSAVNKDTTTVNIIDPPLKNGKYPRDRNKAFRPAKPSWTYPAPPDMWNTFEGNAQRLPNGNTLICDAHAGTFYEIDRGPSHNIVWQYQLNGEGGGAFRCVQYEAWQFGVGKKRVAKK